MTRQRLGWAMLCGLTIFCWDLPRLFAEELPKEAAEILKVLDQDAEALRAKVEQEIAVKRAAAVEKLQAIQDKYTRDAKLDEAVAVRDSIRGLKFASLRPLPDPGVLLEYRGKNEKEFNFDVIGSVDGTIYGSDVYTDDSDLSTVAVHAGLLRQGERGLIKVTILPGQDSYQGAQRNGVSSSGYAQYPGSYKVELILKGARVPGQPHQQMNRPGQMLPFGAPQINLRGAFPQNIIIKER